MVDLSKTAFVEPITYSTFGCNVFKASPQTPDVVAPDVHIHRRGAVQTDLTAPDGKQIRCWGFVDSSLPLAQQIPHYPSPTMRVTQGQTVHTTLTTSKGPHTIHHHGIEPTTCNDGVGHVSFEVGESYTYQWKPSSAGTFFYHCHRNTALHFEMGMFGFLIVDPPMGEDKVKRVYEDGPAYDREALWVADDMDPRFHAIVDHDAGLCGLDVGLNRFEPEYFLLSGVFNNRTMADPPAKIWARQGERILIRLLNASYSILEVTFPIDVLWCGCDGHPMGKHIWCDSSVIPAGTPISLVTAQRYDLIALPPGPGNYVVKMVFRNWISKRVQNNGKGVLKTRIVVK